MTKKMLGIIELITMFLSGRKSSTAPGANNKHRQRFNLGGLPPRWKGKRMARIMRGGK